MALRHLGEKKINERSRWCVNWRCYAGVDPAHEPISVRPVVHYTMGGIHPTSMPTIPRARFRINQRGRTLGSNSLIVALSVMSACQGQALSKRGINGPRLLGGRDTGPRPGRFIEKRCRAIRAMFLSDSAPQLSFVLWGLG
jgi:hypothetical protein